MVGAGADDGGALAHSDVKSTREAFDDEADTDAEIVGAALLDQRHFLVLYDRYAERVERYVQTRSGPEADIDDLLGETFTRALGKLHTYRRERGTFAAWLFRIARNLTIDDQRSRRRATDALVPDVIDPGPGPESMVIRDETVARVREALGALTADQREALALRYTSELTFADIGHVMGRSEAAAKMLVQRGIQGLRQGWEEGDRHA